MITSLEKLQQRKKTMVNKRTVKGGHTQGVHTRAPYLKLSYAWPLGSCWDTDPWAHLSETLIQQVQGSRIHIYNKLPGEAGDAGLN